MKPKIVSWFCTDYDPIESYEPLDRSEVDLWFDVDIGSLDFVGTNNFQVHLVTQGMLSKIVNKRCILVIPYYDSWNQVLEELKKSLVDCEAKDSQLMFKKIASKYAWEYESYNRV